MALWPVGVRLTVVVSVRALALPGTVGMGVHLVPILPQGGRRKIPG